jgi:hypothetical protein
MIEKVKQLRVPALAVGYGFIVLSAFLCGCSSQKEGNPDADVSQGAGGQSDSGNKVFVKAEWDGGSRITVTAKRLPKDHYYKPAVCWGYGRQEPEEKLSALRTYLPRIGFVRSASFIMHHPKTESPSILYPYKAVDESGKWVVLELAYKNILRTEDVVFTFDLVYPKYRGALMFHTSVLFPRYFYLLPVDKANPEQFNIGKVRKEKLDSAEEDSRILVAEIQRK